jgi:hypothetical protein
MNPLLQDLTSATPTNVPQQLPPQHTANRYAPQMVQTFAPAVKDVLICIPSYSNHPLLQCSQEAFNAKNNPASVVGDIQWYNGDSLVSRGRNKLAKMFLDTNYKYLMFIDDDIAFSWAHINQLRHHNKPIIGGIYCKKKLMPEPVMNTRIGDEDGLSVMREIGTGFMMIRRDVFGAFKEWYREDSYQADTDEPNGIYHDYFKVGVPSWTKAKATDPGRYLSEDYYFCQAAAQIGIKTHLDGSIIVGHHGQAVYPFRESDMIEVTTALLDRILMPNAKLDADKLLALHQASTKRLAMNGIDPSGAMAGQSITAKPVKVDDNGNKVNGQVVATKPKAEPLQSVTVPQHTDAQLTGSPNPEQP